MRAPAALFTLCCMLVVAVGLPWRHTLPGDLPGAATNVVRPGAAAPAIHTPPPSPPITVTVRGATRDIRFDALIAFGAPPLDTICARAQAAVAGTAPPSESPAPDACSREASADTILHAAHTKLEDASKLDGPLAIGAIQDANGLIREAVRRWSESARPGLKALSYAYETLAERLRDARLYDIAWELAFAEVVLCELQADMSCARSAIDQAGQMLIHAGRWFNDANRLRRAAAFLEEIVSRRDYRLDGGTRFDLTVQIGSAYSYASHFAAGDESRSLIDKSIAAYETLLPQAEARAPSFDSAMVWQNLGASYGDRGNRDAGTADFRRALVLYDKSLKYFTREGHRQAWARSMSNMAAARTSIGTREKDLAIHDAAVHDHEQSIAAFLEGGDFLDVGYSRYRLARSLEAKSATAQLIASALGREDEARRDDLAAVGRASRQKALHQLDLAETALQRAGSNDYLARISRLRAEIEAHLKAAAR